MSIIDKVQKYIEYIDYPVFIKMNDKYNDIYYDYCTNNELILILSILCSGLETFESSELSLDDVLNIMDRRGVRNLAIIKYGNGHHILIFMSIVDYFNNNIQELHYIVTLFRKKMIDDLKNLEDKLCYMFDTIFDKVDMLEYLKKYYNVVMTVSGLIETIVNKNDKERKIRKKYQIINVVVIKIIIVTGFIQNPLEFINKFKTSLRNHHK